LPLFTQHRGRGSLDVDLGVVFLGERLTLAAVAGVSLLLSSLILTSIGGKMVPSSTAG
jgi:drug/metabolite transporter (DMT)-like permease